MALNLLATLVGVFMVLYPDQCHGVIVSRSYTVQSSNAGFSGHFATLQPQPTDQNQPRKLALPEQQGYTGKTYICHQASTERGECRYATIYDETLKIPLISAKKYSTNIVPVTWNEANRAGWDFSGDLTTASGVKRQAWPSLPNEDGSGTCGKNFYAETQSSAPTQGDIHRGHLLANSLGAGPRSGTNAGPEGAQATFSLYNVVPQFQHSNTGHWLHNVEQRAATEIVNCLNMANVRQKAFYLVAGVTNHQTLKYSCEDCQSSSEWTFDGRTQKFVTNEKCCKITPQPQELAFPKIMWMAGCCSYQAPTGTNDPETGEAVFEDKVKTFYGRSYNINKQQRQANPLLYTGGNFAEAELKNSVLASFPGLDPFKDTICGGQAPQGQLKRARDPNTPTTDPQTNLPALNQCKKPRTGLLPGEAPGAGSNTNAGTGRKKREVSVDPACTTCQECQRSRVIVKQGDAITLRCEVTQGRPTPTVEWARINAEGNKQVISNSERLQIQSMSQSTEGTYQCEIKNTYGFVRGAVYLDLGLKPDVRIAGVTVQEQPIFVKKDARLEIQCEAAEGNPTPSLTWNRHDAGEGKVVIAMATIEDEGTYTCNGTNRFGSDVASAEVKVRVDGGWSAWSEYSPCSAQCDGGIQVRERLCTNPPPRNGGEQCEGDAEEEEVCNTEECPRVQEEGDLIGPEGLIPEVLAGVGGGVLAGLLATALSSKDDDSSSEDCDRLVCMAGQYAPDICGTSCVKCPQQTFQSRSGQTFCLVCPPGMYQPQEGQTGCIACTPATSAQPTCGSDYPVRLVGETGSGEPNGRVEYLDDGTWTPLYNNNNELNNDNATTICRLLGFPNGTAIQPPQQQPNGQTPFVIRCHDLDDCVERPCENNGSCTNVPNSYTCSCASGFTGNNCETDVDECASSPCQNDGTCIDRINSYTCRCKPGYERNNCQTDINECRSSPCRNGGTCVDGVNSYRCRCRPGFSGNNCQTNNNECRSSPCRNGGTCVDGVNSYRCRCRPGFSGNICQTNINECASRPCLNGGTCVDRVNSYTCRCRGGFTGNRCQQRAVMVRALIHKRTGRYLVETGQSIYHPVSGRRYLVGVRNTAERTSYWKEELDSRKDGIVFLKNNGTNRYLGYGEQGDVEYTKASRHGAEEWVIRDQPPSLRREITLQNKYSRKFICLENGRLVGKTRSTTGAGGIFDGWAIISRTNPNCIWYYIYVAIS